MINRDLRRELELCETDVDGALRRFSGNESLYVSCLGLFLIDPTMKQLNSAVSAKTWDDAFTAAHALKGLAGNMGFIPLFHEVGELVLLIRAGRMDEIQDANRRVNVCYTDIMSAIQRSHLHIS